MDHDEEIPHEAQNAQDVVLPADAAERKRVLNILAQRRYRRRKRERQAVLESLVSQSAEAIRLDSQAITCNEPHNNQSDLDTTPPSTDSSESLDEPTFTSTWPTSNLDFNAYASSTSSSTTTTSQQLNEILQTDEILNATFADDFHIAVSELDLLRAAYENAGRLHSAQLLFDLAAESIFLTSDCSGWIPSLPGNLQPTIAQLTIPHHPTIDILPWPGVRNKLIHMYSLPGELWPRHPVDGGESSLIRLVYDMEDGGVIVSGGDPSEEGAWEIEERFFCAWWWAMDQRVVRMSNEKRVARGLPVLCGR